MAPLPPTIRRRDKWSYFFDNLMSARTSISIAALGLLSLLIILTASGIILFLNIQQDDGKQYTFIEALWQSLLRTLDAGTLAPDTGWGLRLVMLGVTLGGIFVVSAFIGIIVSGIGKKIEELGKGRSLVLEKNHTVILGWSSKIFTIISELIIANQNKEKAHIVILAERDKMEMEDEIRARLPQLGKTKIICRSGKPTDLLDVHIVNINQAQAIIILPNEGEHSDIGVIKSLLAIVNNPRRKENPYNIIAELQEGKNKKAAKFIASNEVTTILSPKIISEIAVQTCLQPGLSIVYSEFLDFANSEIYFKSEPLLHGKSFQEAIMLYEYSCLIGLRQADGVVKIKPPFDTVIQEGDEVIVIAEDDDRVIIGSAPSEIQSKFIQIQQEDKAVSIENILILGWNKWVPSIIRAFDKLLGIESCVHIVSNQEDITMRVNELKTEIKKIRLSFEIADTTDYIQLQSIPLERYQHVMIVASENSRETEEKDAQTLITLVYMRKLALEKGYNLNIVTEMLDVRNMELAQVTKVDDFIVSDKLISLMLAQLSENEELKQVFDELFATEKVRIQLRKASVYILPGEEVTFATVVKAAREKKEIAIGYRLHNEASQLDKNYGIYINPAKSIKNIFREEDCIIVIR